MKIKRMVPYVSGLLFFVSVLLFELSFLSAKIADALNGSVCTPFRNALSAITSVLPISVFETAVLASPIAIFFAVKYTVCGGALYKRFITVLSLLSLLFSGYVLTLGIAYNSRSYVTDFRRSSDLDELVSSAEKLSVALRELDGVSGTAAPSLAELRAELSDAYSQLLRKRISLSRPKPLTMSGAASCMGTLAMYSFPTGEVNINTDAPEYMLAFNLAHEYAHSLGVACEGEANFLAYLVCRVAKNKEIRISGNLVALEYILSDIKKSDREKYTFIYNSLPEYAKGYITEYYNYRKENISPIYRAADRVNFAHLEAVDKYGGASYSVFSSYVAAYVCDTA